MTFDELLWQREWLYQRIEWLEVTQPDYPSLPRAWHVLREMSREIDELRRIH